MFAGNLFTPGDLLGFISFSGQGVEHAGQEIC